MTLSAEYASVFPDKLRHGLLQHPQPIKPTTHAAQSGAAARFGETNGEDLERLRPLDQNIRAIPVRAVPTDPHHADGGYGHFPGADSAVKSQVVLAFKRRAELGREAGGVAQGQKSENPLREQRAPNVVSIQAVRLRLAKAERIKSEVYMQSNSVAVKHDITSDYSSQSQYADKAPGLLTNLKIAASQLAAAGYWTPGDREANDEARCAALCGLKTLIAALRTYAATEDFQTHEPWDVPDSDEEAEPATVWNDSAFKSEVADLRDAVKKMRLPSMTRDSLAGALSMLSGGVADRVISAIAHAEIAHRIISGRAR